METLNVTLLGTGTSAGIPLIQCSCPVCLSSDTKNKRLRSSAWIHSSSGSKSILIDTSTDLRQQALHFQIPRVDAVLYTHPHADHLHGIDELRSYNFIQKTSIPLFGNAWTQSDLAQRFSYAFAKKRNQNLPDLEFHLIDTQWASFEVLGLSIIPISLEHGARECVGYRLGSFAYITDCHAIPETSMARLTHLETLVLDCVRYAPHPTHLHLQKSLEIIQLLRPQKTFLTHLSHEMDHTQLSQELPAGVFVGYDGLEFSI